MGPSPAEQQAVSRKKLMPRIAKTYIALIICSGTAVLLVAAGSWSSSSVQQFLTFLGLAAISSTLKVRIPGIEGTMSPNFVFLVLGMPFCSFSEVTAIALVAALVQSLWTAKQPRLVQVAFSAAALVLSASVADQASYLLLGPSVVNSPVALVILAGSLYLPLNAALVSAVIGFVNGKPLAQVGRICYRYVFPYFMGGIVFAGLVSGAFSRPTVGVGAILLLPVMALAYLYSLSRAGAVVPVPIQSAHTEDEEFVEVGSGSPRPRS
jgi:hypothetical protein